MASSKTQVDTTWTTPRTWTEDETVLTAWMNAIRDQLNAGKTPAYAFAHVDEAANFTTTSITFTEMDSTGTQLELTIVTGGGPVEVHFTGFFTMAGAYNGYVDITVDGTQLGTEDGFVQTAGAGAATMLTISTLALNLAAGSHTFKMVWKVSNVAGTLTLYAQTLHPVFWVKEIG